MRYKFFLSNADGAHLSEGTNILATAPPSCYERSFVGAIGGTLIFKFVRCDGTKFTVKIEKNGTNFFSETTNFFHVFLTSAVRPGIRDHK